VREKRILLSGIVIATLGTISFALLNKHTPATEGFTQSIVNEKPVIYELGSNSCSSCVAMLEVMKKVEANHSNSINIVRIDAFKDEKSIESFNIRAIPTQVIRNAKGIEIFRHEGFISYESLVAKLDDLGILTKNLEVN
jgi:thioredoxin 1